MSASGFVGSRRTGSKSNNLSPGLTIGSECLKDLNPREYQPYICQAPIKYKYANHSSPNYVTDGEGSVTFRLIKQRADFAFGFFSGDITNPVLEAISNTISFADSNAPVYPRLALASSWDQMTVTWTSGYGKKDADPVVQWGTKDGKESWLSPASTLTFARHDMCGPPARSVGWRDPGFSHTAYLKELWPSTRDYYKVGHRMKNGDYIWDQKYYFTSSPALGEETTQRVVIFGDMGKNERDGSIEFNQFQHGALNTTDQLVKDVDNYDLVYHIGDLAYANGMKRTARPLHTIRESDPGLNMRSKLSGGTTQETYGSKGSATALAVLDTLREDEDYVTLITFDADGSKLLNTTMIYNKALLYRSFSIRLPQNVAGGSKMNTNASATSDAINSAITALSTPTSPVPANYLKVVVVLTTGEQFQNLSQMNISSNTGVNTFVYNFLAAAPQCSASTRISIESIAVSKVDNPLYALQSLYSFLASVHKSFVGDGTVDYGNMYADYSGIDNSTLTLSKAAFGSSGELLGVIGIDFYEEKVNEQYPTLQFQSIVDTSRSHQPQTPFDATKNLNTSVCLNITDACPSLADTYVQGFLCEKKSDDKRIGCCGKCIPKKNKLPIILGGTFGGLGGVIAILLFGFLFYCCCRRKAEAVISYCRRKANAVISYCCRRKAKAVKATEGDDMDGSKAPGSVSKP